MLSTNLDQTFSCSKEMTNLLSVSMALWSVPFNTFQQTVCKSKKDNHHLHIECFTYLSKYKLFIEDAANLLQVKDMFVASEKDFYFFLSILQYHVELKNYHKIIFH